MATQVNIAKEQLCLEVLEKKLTDLTNHVQLQKEIMSSNFQELHSMLAEREHSLLQELDYVVTEATREMEEKKKHLQELYTARESLQRNITSNELKEVLEASIHGLDDKIGKELSREIKMGWVESVWKKEECVIDVCKVILHKDRPFQSEDYRLKLSPIWSREHPHNNYPNQIAIDDTTNNIFVSDLSGPFLVFVKESNYVYNIPIIQGSFGVALTKELIYVSTGESLLEISILTSKCIRSIHTQYRIWGIDIDKNENIYGCEYSKNSIVVYDKNLTFQKRIQLNTSHIDSDTQTNCIKLYDNKMFVMFGHNPHNPHSHLQIFSLEGKLIRCLISRSDIQLSYFFSIDTLGNIVTTDYNGNEIKIFSNTGELIHTITNDMLPEGKKLCRPTGVVVDRENRIIIAHENKECYLLAF